MTEQKTRKVPRNVQVELHKRAERLVDLARQRRILEDEEAGLKASTLSDMDGWGLASWADDFFKLDVREREGRESADVKELKAAGLGQFVKKGNPSRFVAADVR